MRKEVKDIYMYTLGVQEDIKRLRACKRGHDLYYYGHIIECQKIIDFLRSIDNI